jgi:predicted TIM-barrel fold metal-dependent hydrolase
MKYLRFWLSFLTIYLACSDLFAQHSSESVELAKTIPIADVHMHTYQQNPRSASWWKEQMDANGVKWGGAVGDYREDVQAELKDRYIPAIGQIAFFKVFFKDNTRGLIDPENPVFQDLYGRADKLFESGLVKGFGEFHTDNHTSGHPRIRRVIRTDNPAMRKFYAIAERYSGFVQIHAEFDKDFEKDILSLSADFPNVTTVLSHCLSTNDANSLGSLFRNRTNITCEMSATGEAINRLLGLNKSPIAFNSSGPFKEWKKLIESHPDQVMLGTDPCCGADRGYSELISELRVNLLPYFSPEIIEKIAYKNAVRVFRLKE